MNYRLPFQTIRASSRNPQEFAWMRKIPLQGNGMAAIPKPKIEWSLYSTKKFQTATTFSQYYSKQNNANAHSHSTFFSLGPQKFTLLFFC